ncbi:MAG: YdcF family protein [Lewinella sp.]|uniref:YdcF family protein n=1 Tax=Lewinella sp. TaxID=2004506 RepID=UPI003D6BDF82
MLRSFTAVILNPIALFWIIVIIGLLRRIFFTKSKGTCFFAIAFVWLFVSSSSPLPIYLAYKHEGLHPVLWQVNDSIDHHILILGGGHSYSPALPENNQLSTNALGRLVEGCRLWQQDTLALLVGSGGKVRGLKSQAELLMNTAVKLGVSSTDTAWLKTPLNTGEEALAYVRRFGDGQNVILVTSALHMPRALYLFENSGVKCIPAPTNHRVKIEPGAQIYNFRPSIKKLRISAELLHEYAGMLYAWFKVGDQK